MTAAALVVAAGTIGAAHVLTVPSIADAPAGRTVTPVPAEAQRVCAGGVLQLADGSGSGGGSSTSTSASPVGRERVAATASSGSEAAAGSGTVDRSTLAASTTGGSDPTVITAPAGRTTPAVAGSGSQSVDSGDLVGFAAASCDDPATSSWLVGGSTETGRTSLVTLSNPTDVNATVDLDVYDATGKVSAPGTTGIVVAPRTQKVVPLSGFVSDAASPVVHVTSAGGQVVATIQQSIVRTLTPGGVDIVQAGAAPSRSQTIPAAIVQNVDAARAGDDTADADSIIRLFVPGSAPAHVTMQITSAGGTGTTVQATADPGVVTDVPLDDFPDATYSIAVTADVPIVAAARTSTVTGTGVADFAWWSSADALTGPTLLDVAAGDGATLAFVNTGRRSATVTFGSGSDRTTLTVDAGATASSPVPTNTGLTIRGAAGLVVGVSYSGDDGIAGFPVRSAAQVSSPVRVYP